MSPFALRPRLTGGNPVPPLQRADGTWEVSDSLAFAVQERCPAGAAFAERIVVTVIQAFLTEAQGWPITVTEEMVDRALAAIMRLNLAKTTTRDCWQQVLESALTREPPAPLYPVTDQMYEAAKVVQDLNKTPREQWTAMYRAMRALEPKDEDRPVIGQPCVRHRRATDAPETFHAHYRCGSSVLPGGRYHHRFGEGSRVHCRSTDRESEPDFQCRRGPISRSMRSTDRDFDHNYERRRLGPPYAPRRKDDP